MRSKFKLFCIIFAAIFFTSIVNIYAINDVSGQARFSSGSNHSLYVDNDKNLWAWGSNLSGQVGNGTNTNVIEPVRITDGDTNSENDTWRFVAAGSEHSLAIKDDGTLWAWGSNLTSELGDGTIENKNAPVQISSANDWTHISAGSGFSIALRGNGVLFVWGDNGVGQLGFDPIRNVTKTTPTQIEQNQTTRYTAISAGGFHVISIDTLGQLWSWGNNGNGQLGRVTTQTAQVFTLGKVNDDINWSKVFAGNLNSFAIKTDRSLFSWGNNGSGKLGIGNTVASVITPTIVNAPNGKKWLSVATGDLHTIGITDSDGKTTTEADRKGELFGWGGNLNFIFQLGIPEVGNKSTPFQIGSLVNWSAVAAGSIFSAALNESGNVLTTGSNDLGQLGNGTIFTTKADEGFQSSFVGVPDLVIKNITVIQDDPSPGDEIDLNIFFENKGSGKISATDVIKLDIRLSKDSLYDLADIRIVDTTDTAIDPTTNPISVSGELPANREAVIATKVRLKFPDSASNLIIDGDNYFVSAQILSIEDSTGAVIDETVTTNNGGASTVAIDLLPDLKLAFDKFTLIKDSSVIDLTTNANNPVLVEGDVVELELSITNTGKGALPISRLFDIDFLLSENQTVNDSDDILLKEDAVFPTDFTITSISNPNFLTSVAAKATVRLTASNLRAGSFNLISVLDVNNDIPESTEDVGMGEENNLTFTTVQPIIVNGSTSFAALDLDGNTIGVTAADVQFGGDKLWFGQSTVTSDGVDAVSSPFLEVGKEAYIEVKNIAGPTLVEFQWKVDSNRAENLLKFTVNGVESIDPTDGEVNHAIFGKVGFKKVTALLPFATNTIRWTFVKGAEGDGFDIEKGWVDSVVFDNTNANFLKPDFELDIVNFNLNENLTAGTLSLNVELFGRNVGVNSPLPGNPDFAVFLSTDAEYSPDIDIELIPDVTSNQSVGSNDRFGYLSVFDLIKIQTGANKIPQGDYFLIVLVDPKDAGGTLYNPNSPTGFIGKVDELEEIKNNLFSSSTAGISISERPDLVPQTFTITKLGTTNPNESSNILDIGETVEFNFSIKNTNGNLAETSFVSSLMLSSDNLFGTTDDFTITNIPETEAFNTDQTRTYIESIQLPVTAPFGEPLFLGILVDSSGVITENNENNNAILSTPSGPFFISEVNLAVAVDLDSTHTLSNRFVGGAQSSVYPWYGQTDDSFVGNSAGRSVKIPASNSAHFEVSIEVIVPTDVSFSWKVSSEKTTNDQGVVKQDELKFFIDDTVQASIAGELEWSTVTFKIEPIVGQTTRELRWSYEKDASIDEGKDAGFVDNITVVANPRSDLIVSSVTSDKTSYSTSESITLNLKVKNNGAGDIANNQQFVTQFLLSTDSQFNQDTGATQNDIILGTEVITLNSGLAVSAETASLPFTFDIPDIEFPFQENFFIGIRLDTASQVDELNEANNNSFSTTQVTVVPLIKLNETLETSLLQNIVTSGARKFLGANVTGTAGGSAAQITGLTSGQESVLEASITGPVLLSFDWTIQNSLSSQDIFKFELDSKVMATIANDLPLTTVNDILVPEGSHQIKWTYSKASSALSDFAAVDNIQTKTVNVNTVSRNTEFNQALETFTGFDPPPVWEIGGAGIFFANTSVTGAVDSDALTTSRLVVDEESFVQTEFIGPGLLTFRFKVENSPQNLDILTFQLDGVEFDLSTISNDDTNSFKIIDVDQTTVGNQGILIPAGTHQLKWIYRKKSSEINDFAVIDNIIYNRTAVPSDFEVESISTTPGQFLLNGQTTLPFEVLIENQGGDSNNSASQANGTNNTIVDVEIFLSTTQSRTSGTVILLGILSFNQTFVSGQKLFIDDDLPIPQNTTAGSYFLGANIVTNRTEVSTANNIKFTTAQDVTITQIPDLTVTDITVDDKRNYFESSSLNLNYNLSNIGAGDISSATAIQINVSLQAIEKSSGIVQDGSVLLENISIQTALPGNLITQSSPISFNLVTTLPTATIIQSTILNDNAANIEDYNFRINISADSLNVITESNETNNIIASNLNFLIFNTPTVSETFQLWRARYNLDNVVPQIDNNEDAKRDTDGDGNLDLIEYALDLNPLVSDIALRVLISKVNNQDFLSTSFNLNLFASDIVVNVNITDASSNLIKPEHVKFNQLTSAPRNLTTEVTNNDPFIISALNQGYSGRVTVVDEFSSSLANSRMMVIEVILP